MHAQNCNNSTFLFVLKCNMLSTVFTCLVHANSCCSIWISIAIYFSNQGLWKALYMDITRSHIYMPPSAIYWFYNWTLFQWCPKVYNEQPKKYTSNNQTSIKSHFNEDMYYIAGCWRSIWGTCLSLVDGIKMFWLHVKK